MSSVMVCREPQVWSASETIVRVMQALGVALQLAAPDRQVIPSADAFRAHWSRQVLRASARSGLFCWGLAPSQSSHHG